MWALSYSIGQKAFHISTLQQEADANMKRFMEGKDVHYSVIFVSNDKELVHAKADELRDTLCR